MSIVILTGPPAAGKDTLAASVASVRKGCAIVNVDDLRQMIRHGAVAPWEGAEGRRQHELGIRNACAVARNLTKEGFDVVVLDVITDEQASLYRAELDGLGPLIVRLLPTWEEITARTATRPLLLTWDEIRMLYEQQGSLATCDMTIDNSTMTPEAVAREINTLFD